MRESTCREVPPDPQPGDWSKQGRQFAVMDAKGNVEAFTGPKADAWAGHRKSKYCSAQGNILAGPDVVDSMVRAFEHDHPEPIQELRRLVEIAARQRRRTR